MVVGDVFEIKVSQTTPNIGDEMLNVFFYKLMTGEFVLDDLIGQFVLDVVLQMRTIQSVACQYRAITVTNLFNLDEFFVRTYDVNELVGLVNLAVAPPSTALNFTLHRTSRTVRNGSKRIGGVPNPTVQEGRITDSTYLGDMSDLADAMSAELTEPISGAVLRPVIVKRIKTANPDYPDNSKYPFKYTLPTEQGETPIVEVGQTTFSIYTSTQVSRKTNR
jgi:hypothetical protein